MVFGKTKKTHSAILISLFLLLSVFFTLSLTSCDNAVSSSQNEEADNTKTPAGPDKGYLRFRVTVPDGNARTALPEINVNNIQDISITGILNGNSQNLGTWADISGMQNASISVQPGEWQLTLFARYNGFSFSSTQTVSVSVGSVSNVSFALSSNTMNGGCTIQVNFASTREAHHASYQITNLATSASTGSGTLTIQNGTSNKYVVLERNSSSPLSNGNYTVIITFYGDLAESIILNTFRETMHVQGGFVSTITRTIDLNEIFTIEYHNTEDASVASGSLVENYSINSIYSTITFPDLSKTNNVFRGWYSSPTFDSTSRVTRLPDNATGTQHFYAKWEPYHPLKYKVVNRANEAKDWTSSKLAADLPALHNPTQDTTFPASITVDGDTVTLSYYTSFSSSSGPSNHLTANTFAADAIAEDYTGDTTIYVKPEISHVYVNPDTSLSGGNDNYWPYLTSGTAARSVSEALKWIGTGSTYSLYVTGTSLTAKTDIEALSNGPVIKSNGVVPLVIDSSLTLENVTLDGGVDWGTIGANESVLGKTPISSGNGSYALISVTNPAYGNSTIILSNITMQNIMSTAALKINGANTEVVLNDCTIKNCGSAGMHITAGKMTMNRGELSHNGATNGGAVFCANGTGEITFNQTLFHANKADYNGGAVYINQHESLCTFNNCTFTCNTLASSDRLGKIIFDYGNSTSSNLYLKGNTSIDSGDITTNGLQPITIDSTTAATGSTNQITLSSTTYGTAPSYNVKILDFGSMNATQIDAAKDYFILADTNYIINDAGYIKPLPGTITVTPGLPGTYSCGFEMTSDRTVTIKIKDASGALVPSSLISSIKVTLYETGDVIDFWESASFTYPAFLSAPTNTSFYVEADILPSDDSTVAYSYDFYAGEI